MMLEGVRVWLSGSKPKSEGEAELVRRFVAAFATEVFRRGGRIVHGSEPWLREVLLKAAADYKAATGRKAGLVLAVSRFFSKEPQKYGVDLAVWDALCAEPTIETREALADPERVQAARNENLAKPHSLEDDVEPAGATPGPVEDGVSREVSLLILREAMVDQCNAVVAVGGKWWEVAADKAGVPKEVEIAHKQGLPLFLLGAMGGSLKSYLERHPERFRDCKNGLTEEQNRELAAQPDPEKVARLVCDQLERLPLRPVLMDVGRPFRILCLDGGGIRGVFTAAVLRRWEEMTGRKVIDHFDMVAGTSTGGILAIGLGLGMSPARMERFYIDKGSTIFPVESGIGSLAHSLRHWVGSKFSAAVLRRELVAAYGEADLKPPADPYRTRLVVLAYDSETDLPQVFRAWPSSQVVPYRTFDPVEVALATAAAPTYFDPNQMDHIRAVDGGVWANSPTTIALAEAIHELRIDPSRIQLLSVGTTYDASLLGRPAQLNGAMVEALVKPAAGRVLAKLARLLWRPIAIHGKLGWLPNIAGFLMKAQAQTADYVCRRVLGDRFVRIDAATLPTSLDDVAVMNRLIGLGVHAADESLAEVRTQFLNGVPAGGP